MRHAPSVLGGPVKCLTSSYNFVTSHPAFESAFSKWKISPRNRPVSRYARRGRFASRITPSHQGGTHTAGIDVSNSKRHTSLDRQWHPRPHLFRPIVATHQQKMRSLQLLLS